MPRTFSYARVSTLDQDTGNQQIEIQAAGFTVEPQRAVSETVSGGTPAMSRPGFKALVDRLERDDVLVVSRLDRLGRDVVDVVQTVTLLAEKGVKTHVLALGGADLTSAAGKMILGVLSSVAAFERDLLKERTAAGLVRAKAAGKVLGRPRALPDATEKAIKAALKDGSTIYALAKQHDVDRKVIKRIRDSA